jgi:enamine deaminase RidA (YjgF/YER057c/UK114 family)
MAHVSQVQYFNEAAEKQLGFVALVQSGKTLHLSGIIAVDEALNVVAPGDMVGQIERVYDIMEKTLAKSGATLQHVVNELIFVTDLQKYGPEASAARARRYAKCTPPATTGVQVSALFFPGAMIEIQATAVLP